MSKRSLVFFIKDMLEAIAKVCGGYMPLTLWCQRYLPYYHLFA